jgi:HSP20 family protein
MADNITRYNQPMGVTPLSEAIDRLFRDAFTWPRSFGAGFGPAAGGGMAGPGNLYETNESYILQVPLPGVKVDELEITAHENVLTLQGKTEIAAPEGARAIWGGMTDQEFREVVQLPGDVDAERASAEYHDGILTLTLPKAEHARVRTIKIGGGRTQPIEGQKR